MIVLIMGVSGSGKTTVGERLAKQLGCSFAEGDAFHPPQNVAKMQSGTPLNDADREPWLRSIAEQVDAASRPRYRWWSPARRSRLTTARSLSAIIRTPTSSIWKGRQRLFVNA